jgi:hypothetical protein
MSQRAVAAVLGVDHVTTMKDARQLGGEPSPPNQHKGRPLRGHATAEPSLGEVFNAGRHRNHAAKQATGAEALGHGDAEVSVAGRSVGVDGKSYPSTRVNPVGSFERRLRGWMLSQQGLTQTEIGRALGICQAQVSLDQKDLREAMATQSDQESGQLRAWLMELLASGWYSQAHKAWCSVNDLQDATAALVAVTSSPEWTATDLPQRTWRVCGMELARAATRILRCLSAMPLRDGRPERALSDLMDSAQAVIQTIVNPVPEN